MLTYILLAVFVIVSLSCVRGVGKQKEAWCCTPVKAGRSSVATQTGEINEMYIQIKQMEQTNAVLLKEIESFKTK